MSGPVQQNRIMWYIRRQTALSEVGGMVIRSGSIVLLLSYLTMFGVVLGLLVSVAFLFARKVRWAARLSAASVTVAILCIVGANVAAWLTPQTIINAGDSYCWDLWCMGIKNVNAASEGSRVTYKLDVRIFSDANTVQTSSENASLYLEDDRGRRYPLVPDASVTPFNIMLSPGQSIDTTLTFVAPSDSRQLFLGGEAPLPNPVPLQWQVFKVFADLHFGYERLSHKPTLLRVL
jgi:hypothetical protein